ncbi:hypothetical protein FRC16_003663 [Serendipita sp. 398]|nr:hypothetical protein FRC16_003663 [Serendipita sp. 398]
MEDSSAAAVLEPETDIDSHRVIASFAHVAGQYFATRDQPQSSIRTLGLRTFTSEIDKLVTLAQKVMTSKENDQEEMKRMSHIARLGLIYKAEILSELQDWDGLINTLKSMEGMQYVLLTTYEAFADILWKNKECPVHVLYAGFETILRLSSDQGVMSVQKFSRWLRAICTILLSGGRDADRAKALAYTQQAIDLLKEHGDITDTESDQHYPDSERSWLLATAFNTGVQCTRSLQKPEAKEWFEVAIALCQFVAGSPRQKV